MVVRQSWKFIFAAMLMASSPVAAQPSYYASDVLMFMDFGDALNHAAIVARVHLISRVSVGTRPAVETGRKDWQPGLDEEPSCGYLYKAEVVKSYKGNEKEFDFFSAVDDDFSGFDHDYFVIVFQRLPDRHLLDLDDLTLTIPDEQAREINCLISQKYYVGRLEQSMFSFDLAASQQLGGEWLSPPNRRGLGWCTYNEAFLRANFPNRSFHDRDVAADAKSYGISSWTKLRASEPTLFTEKLGHDTYPARSWAEYEKVLLENLGNGPYIMC